ncbi:MAG: HlyC/CorC family transporter [Caldilineae bacterium]|nr:HlyC/CorC family transporter [Chloroflexota bacterium]MCB9175996.1 HlyC/CorC family transporter [Caldilineae bacterium]
MAPESLASPILLALGLALAALAAAADAAFDETNRVRLRELVTREERLSVSVWRLLDDPARTWTAVRLLEVLGLVLATTGFLTLLRLDASSRAGAPWLEPVGLALLAGLGVEYLPRMLVNRHPERSALTVALPVDLIAYLVFPIFQLIARFTGYLPHAHTRSIREDELRSLLNIDEEGNGGIEPDEIEMMAGIIELGDTKVREVMVPRIDIVAIPLEASLEEALDLILEAGHSRIPVYRETIDDIAGLLYAKDLLEPFRSRNFEARIVDLLRDPHVVPESMLVKTLLGALRSARIHMAIVVDEYGGTAGLVTIEDLIEEIVGEIQDEYDEESPRVEHIGEDEGVFSGGIDIDDVNRMMDIRLPSDAVDTLAGLVLDRLGKVPEAGELARFEDADIEVLALEGRRIHRVRVTRRHPEDDPDEAEVPNGADEDGAAARP